MQSSSEESPCRTSSTFKASPLPSLAFSRVTEHRRLSQILEADELPYHRFVVKAGYFAELSSRLVENAKRFDRMRDVLGSLEETSGSATRSPGFPSASASREVKRDRR